MRNVLVVLLCVIVFGLAGPFVMSMIDPPPAFTTAPASTGDPMRDLAGSMKTFSEGAGAMAQRQRDNEIGVAIGVGLGLAVGWGIVMAISRRKLPQDNVTKQTITKS